MCSDLCDLHELVEKQGAELPRKQCCFREVDDRTPTATKLRPVGEKSAEWPRGKSETSERVSCENPWISNGERPCGAFGVMTSAPALPSPALLQRNRRVTRLATRYPPLNCMFNSSRAEELSYAIITCRKSRFDASLLGCRSIHLGSSIDFLVAISSSPSTLELRVIVPLHF